jgi:hypothetical protein
MRIWISVLVFVLCACQSEPRRVDRPDPRAELSLNEMKAIYASEPDPQRKFDILTDIVHRYSWQILTPDDGFEAQSRAMELLRLAPSFSYSWNYSNAIHHAYLVLGRVRLQGGDTTGAARYLLKATEVKGSPQLSSYGPNMTLAQELLLKGQKQAVLDYLEKSKRFWAKQYSSDTLREWRSQIEDGKHPNFGPSLAY